MKCSHSYASGVIHNVGEPGEKCLKICVSDVIRTQSGILLQLLIGDGKRD